MKWTPGAELNRNASVPLYLQIATDIAAKIGRVPEFKDRLPSEAGLADGYGVSRITIRLALDHLTTRGLIVRRQGKGTFVSGPQRRTLNAPIPGVMDLLNAQGVESRSELLKFGPAIAPDDVIAKLELPSSDAIFLQRRYRILEQPAVVTEGYYPVSMVNMVRFEDAEKQSALHFLVEKAGLRLGRSEITVQVVAAPAHISPLLEIDADSALMMLRRVTATEDGRLCEHSTLYARAGIGEFAINADETARHHEEWRVPSI